MKDSTGRRRCTVRSTILVGYWSRADPAVVGLQRDSNRVQRRAEDPLACNSPLAVNTKDRQARTQIARHICIVIKKASKRGRVRRPWYSASYRHELCFVLCFDPVGKKRTEAVAVVVGRRQDGMDGMERRRDAFPIPCRVFLVTTSHETLISVRSRGNRWGFGPLSTAMSVMFRPRTEGTEHPQQFELYRERDSGGKHDGKQKMDNNYIVIFPWNTN